MCPDERAHRGQWTGSRSRDRDPSVNRGAGLFRLVASSRAVTAALVALLASAIPAGAQAIRVGSFTKTTGGAPVAQPVPHGLGQTPKAIILWTDGKTNESFSANFLYAFGMTDGTTSKSTAMAGRTNAAVPVSERRMANKALTIVD